MLHQPKKPGAYRVKLEIPLALFRKVVDIHDKIVLVVTVESTRDCFGGLKFKTNFVGCSSKGDQKSDSDFLVPA